MPEHNIVEQVLCTDLAILALVSSRLYIPDPRGQHVFDECMKE